MTCFKLLDVERKSCLALSLMQRELTGYTSEMPLVHLPISTYMRMTETEHFSILFQLVISLFNPGVCGEGRCLQC